MKLSLLLSLLLAFFSACTNYQYLTVSGIDIPKNEKNELISENDTLKVQYNFSDYRGKVGIHIYNKTSEPIEIDWRKSAIIIDGKAVSYFTPKAIISGTLDKDTLALQNRVSRVGDPIYLAGFNGSVLVNEPTQFIPPTSGIFKIPVILHLQLLHNLPDETAKKESISVAESPMVSYKKIEFTKAASPVQLRSYLTLRIGSTGSQKEFTLQHNFYVSEIWQTNYGPSSFPENVLNRGDRFYLEP